MKFIFLGLLLFVFSSGASANTESATFSMYCYWTGEATLGRVPGIINSKIGTLDGREIVRVDFDSGTTNLLELTKALKSEHSFYSLITRNEGERDHAQKFLKSSEITVITAEPSFVEAKYSLKASHPEIYYLDLTEHQAIVLNSWSYFGGTMPDVLTASQKELLKRIKMKLHDKSGDELMPARSGSELPAYRTQLARWLEK